MTKKLNVAVLGAGKIGRYHVREFSHLGAKVVAILGSSKESSVKNSKRIKEDFGITAKPYHVLEELLRNEKIDAVSVCTPPELHENHVRTCLEMGLHVICEKPFIKTNDDYNAAKKLFDLAEKKGKILTVNTQWASAVEYFKRYVEMDKLEELHIEMEPEEKGVGMLTDHLPHANSILAKLIPNGEIKEINFPIKEDERIEINFIYGNEKNSCRTKYIFKTRKKRPGTIIFSINQKKFSREIGMNYRQFFSTNKEKFEIEDPLRVSLRKFLDAVGGYGTPLISKEEALENIALSTKIIERYHFNT